jgi:hypothetical protein
MSEHVLYEIEMFSRTTALLTPHIWETVPAFMADGAQNALIESFTIHVRGLHDFLYATPKGDDVSAADWFPGREEEWARLRGPEPAVLIEARRRTGKEIAHLTYARLERAGDGKLWPHQEIVDALGTGIFRFYTNVDRDLVCDKFAPRAMFAAMSVASVAKRGRVGEPGVPYIDLHTGYGMSVATQTLRPINASADDA